MQKLIINPAFMKHLLFSMLFLFCFRMSAQTPTENYVKTTTYTAPSTGAITENDTLVSVTYFDGLGRAKQSVAVGAGGQGQDLVTPVVYDSFGRQTKEYLPYAAATAGGNIHLDPLAQVEAFYAVKHPGTPNPYSEKVLEASPLSRVLEQGAPGADWQADPLSDSDHTIKFEYGTNAEEEVRLFKVTTLADTYASGLTTYVPSLQEEGFYAPGRLYKTTTKDENWQPGDGQLHTTEEFKDFQGRVFLKRTFVASPPSGEPMGAADTYYVYDAFGNLSFVLPPRVEPSDGVSAQELSELCYQYVYDHRNRLVEKKLPGKGWEFIVYNRVDQPVLTQDANLQADGQWLFTKYDKFARVVYTGSVASPDSRETLQTILEAAPVLYENKIDTPNSINGTDLYYTNSAFPTTGITLLTITYYDNYTFDLQGGSAEDSYGVTPTTRTKTLLTGSKTRIIGTNQWITTVHYYDEKARPVYTYTQNDYLQTTDKVKTQLDFTGKVVETTSEHTKAALAAVTAIEQFTYDTMGRLLTHTHQIAGHPEETLAQHVYDELGQLIQKKTGNTQAAPLQTVDYTYNIRGWLTGINDVNTLANDLFSFQIRYNDPTTGTPLYNGNISQTHWRTANTDNSLKDYNYSYDALNRITSAIDNTGHYNLNSISYDKNGNILHLNRQGHLNEPADSFGVMDALVYSYDNGNKLLKVEDIANDTFGFKDDAVATADNSDDYTYDANGNMISDTNKGITNISYNHLNLPEEITITGGNILYIYDAAGGKQRKIVTDNATITTTDYAGSYIYENSSLKFLNHVEGYLEPDGAGGYEYVYQYKDQVNNVRLSYSDLDGNGSINPSTEILHERNYYPFGLLHLGYNNVVNGVVNNHKQYQGQEYTDDLGLNVHEWRFRFSDPAIGRFWSVDPLAEEYNYQSPYNFSENRVIDAFELEGLEKVSIHTKSFIPFKTLGPTGEGGGYSGDNRGFGDAGKSRMTGRFDLNLSGSGITLTGKNASGADTYDSDGNFITHSEAGFEGNVSFGENSMSDGTSAATDLGFHISGNNDAIFGSPDIDVKGALGIGVVENKDGSSTAVISGEMFGDKFPANETFMTDQSGTRIFLGVSGADGTPLTSLPGNNNRTMSTFTINVNFNSDGNATGVNYNGTSYSIEDWNKRFTSLNAASNVSTNND